MQTINLSDEMVENIRRRAANRGIDTSSFAEEMLNLAISVSDNAPPSPPKRKFKAMDFSGIAPTGRTAAEIDAYIEAERASWDRDEP